MRICTAALLFGLLLLQMRPAHSHHSFAAHYRTGERISLEGVVSEWLFINPHTRILIDVAGDDGEVATWTAEGPAGSSLARAGWSVESLRAGDVVTLTGQPALDDSKLMMRWQVVMRDGARLEQDFANSTSVNPATVATVRSTARLDGAPDISGILFAHDPNRTPSISAAMPGVLRRTTGAGADLLNEPLLTERAAEIRRNFTLADDPAIQCEPFGLPRQATTSFPMQITQEADRMLIRYEIWDARRTIYMDGRTHPQDTAVSALGHSIGRWESPELLVIETVGLKPTLIELEFGLFSSEGLRVLERYTVGTGSQGERMLSLEMTLEDPMMLREPWTMLKRWYWVPDYELSDYSCDVIVGQP